MNTCKTIGALAVALTAWAAQAQGVYRCGDSYSQQPCAGGKAIEAPHQPTAAERAGAAAAARRDGVLAATLEKERLRQEAQAPSAYIPPPRADSGAAPQRQGPDKSATRRLDMFTAVAPNSKAPGESRPAKPSSKARKKDMQGKAATPQERRIQAQAAVRTTNAGPQPAAR